MGRPRKLGRRKPSGGLIYDKLDNRFPTALSRIRDFGVSITQSVSPLAGHLAGVMYLKGKLTAEHLGHFFSYQQTMPVPLKGIHYGVRVSGGGSDGFRPHKGYWRMTRIIGRDINILHELANDRLICSIDYLKSVLLKVPLTAGGSAYITACETHHPNYQPRAKSV